MQALLKFSPEAIENSAIRVEPNHSVLYSNTVHKGLLVIEEVSVWDPELVCYSVVQRQVERDPEIGQPLIPPILLEVHSQCVVLWEVKRARSRNLSQRGAGCCINNVTLFQTFVISGGQLG